MIADDKAGNIGGRHKARMLADPRLGLVVLDEINIVLKYRYLDVRQVLADLRTRPPLQHVVMTGRAAAPEIIALGDTVTEMRPIKHAFEQGIRARKGVEW